MDRRPLLHALIWIYCLSWAFDYRAQDEGGSPIQFAFFGLSLLSGGLIGALSWRRLLVKPTGWFTLIWGGYLLMTVAVAVLQHVNMGNFVRNSSVPVLLFVSLIVTASAAAWGFPVRTMVTPMLIAGVINIFWKMYYALVVVGIPLERVRIELLSPCQPFLIAFMFLALALRRKMPVWPVLIGAVGMSAYLLSVTRSAVFIFAAAALGSWMALRGTRRMGLLPADFFQRKLSHAGIAAAAVVLVAGGVGIFSPQTYERWYERIFSGGSVQEQASIEPSAATRLAEHKAFIDIMAEDPLSWVWGKGVGADYYWDESYVPELAYYTYGNEDEFRGYAASIWFPGHSLWTYAIFTSGIIGFLCHAGLFGIAIFTAVRSTRLLGALPGYSAEEAWLPFAGLLAYLSQSITFNPFQERVGGIVLGVLIAMPQFIHHAAWRRTAQQNALPASAIPGIPPLDLRTAPVQASAIR